ncbi:unnamed protein product [Sphenostylis stenocarpa]|uniref:Uncharacterized protein n=1 Tax=Sphenostylis stenocarpa TaxID=92480 RepID=A0AA86S580_9FABA|nr:unnamed protein product [Sphenostylis stenocarpa]
MEGWSGVLRVPLHPDSRTFHRIGASLYLSPESKTIFEGTSNPVIERLSNVQKLSEIVVSKFGSSINAWHQRYSLCDDFGLNTVGAYLTNNDVFERLMQEAPELVLSFMELQDNGVTSDARLTRPFGVVEEVACNPSTVGRGCSVKPASRCALHSKTRYLSLH